MKKYIGRNGFEKIKNILSTRRAKALMGLGLFVSSSMVTTLVIKGFKKNVEVEKEIDNNEYVVQYANTNIYAEAPISNKIQRMQVGDIVELTADGDSYYNKQDGEWISVAKEEAEIDTMWSSCKVSETQNDGYIPTIYISKYLPYSTIDSATFIKEGNEDPEELEKMEIINSRVWVYKDDSTKDNNNIYEAIIRDKSDQLIKGYIDITTLEQDKQSDLYLGVVNTSTFLRESPIVVELDESNILGQITNGKKVKVIDSIQCGREGMEETWYKCNIDGQEESVYLMGGTIKDINDFDLEAVIQGNDVPVTSKNGSSTRISLYNGDKVKVDTDDVMNGKYKVYYEAGDTSRVGYMESDALLMYGEPIIVEKDDEDLNESKESKEGIVNVSYNEINETNNKVEQDKLVYVVDLCDYNHIDAFEEMIDDLQKDDLLGGAVFRIGVTSRNNELTNDGQVTIVNFVDDSEEYEVPEEDTILLENGYNQIKQKYDGNIKFNGGLGNIKKLERFVELAIDKGVPVGFYYYQGSNNTDRTSAEAAYIYTVVSKIKSDLGKKYENAAKLPYMIDVEDTSSVADNNMKRIYECMDQIELLGTGTDNSDAWCIDNINPKEGYHLLDDYNNQYTYYGAIMQTCAVSPESIKYMDEELAKKGYSMIYNATRALKYNSITYDEIKAIDNIAQYTKDGFNRFENKYENFDKYLAERTDYAQVFLDIEGPGKQGIDMSVATKGTINQIIDGTYQHKTYLDKLETAQNDYDEYVLLSKNDEENQQEQAEVKTDKVIEEKKIEDDVNENEEYDRNDR